MERNVPTMPRGGIFRNGVFLRYGAKRQPSPKIGLDFLTLGCRQTVQFRGMRSTFQPVSTAELFFRQTTNKTSGNNRLR